MGIELNKGPITPEEQEIQNKANEGRTYASVRFPGNNENPHRGRKVGPTLPFGEPTMTERELAERNARLLEELE